MQTWTSCPFGDGKFNPHGSRLPAADLGVAEGFAVDLPQSQNPQDAFQSAVKKKKEEGEKTFLDRELMQKREKKTIDGVRGTFDRLGFDDKETVALILFGHQYGQCHPENSGNDGFWFAHGPNFWNSYRGGGYLTMYKQLKNYTEVITPEGKRQFEFNFLGSKFMMLVSDMVLYWDDVYYEHLQYFMENPKELVKYSISTWKKLTELGCEDLVPESR
eukprot:snap_masked-scaffold_3-processed-gene-16.37-mRNA-1 protein AED:0.01 eAED:0.01 QI:493/1/1/1/1/1/2/77/216